MKSYHLKLGLISAGQGRHLTRLPHGNQEQALSAIIRHRLCCRETEKLVAVLIERPKREHAEILHLPLEILKNRSAPSFSGERKATRQGEPTLAQRLRDLDENHREFSCVLDARLLEPLSPQEREILSATTESVQKLLDRMKKLCAAEAP
jgi:hypothetical protein